MKAIVKQVATFVKCQKMRTAASRLKGQKAPA